MATDFSGIIKLCEEELRALFMDKEAWEDDEWPCVALSCVGDSPLCCRCGGLLLLGSV
jgi:hypothetical protein